MMVQISVVTKNAKIFLQAMVVLNLEILQICSSPEVKFHR